MANTIHCINENCPFKTQCSRFNPDPLPMQSFLTFKPYVDVEENMQCDSFVSLKLESINV